MTLIPNQGVCPRCQAKTYPGYQCPIPGCPPNINPHVIRTWPEPRADVIPVMKVRAE